MRNPLLFILLLFSIAACAHTKDTLKNVQAYYYVHVPGTIAVDRNGKPLTGPNLVYAIYLETKEPLQTATVRINGKEYTTTIDQVKAPVEVGIQRANRKPVLLHPAPGYKLWRLSVTTKRLDESPGETAVPNELILNGTMNNKAFSKTIRQLTELESHMYQ